MSSHPPSGVPLPAPGGRGFLSSPASLSPALCLPLGALPCGFGVKPPFLGGVPASSSPSALPHFRLHPTHVARHFHCCLFARAFSPSRQFPLFFTWQATCHLCGVGSQSLASRTPWLFPEGSLQLTAPTALAVSLSSLAWLPRFRMFGVFTRGLRRILGLGRLSVPQLYSCSSA